MFLVLAEILLVALLFVGAGYDIVLFRLPNWLTAATALLAALIAIATAASQADIAWHLGFGVAVFLLGLVAFQFNLLGGGDIKWIAGLAIWIGPHLDFMRFIVLMGLAGGILAVVVFVVGRLKPAYGRDGGRSHLPYGVAIALAGLDYALRRATIGRDALAWAIG